MLNQNEYLTNPWKYAGGYLDSSTSLYKFGVRYYNPTLGRWTQQDPVGGSLGDLGAANRYVYANDDPVNAVDPSGKDATSCITNVVLGIIGAIGSTVDIYTAGLGLFAVAAGAEALTATVVVTWFLGPIVALATAYGLTIAIESCLGQPFYPLI